MERLMGYYMYAGGCKKYEAGCKKKVCIPVSYAKLNYDPAQPAVQFVRAEVETASMSAEALLLRQVPWPVGLAPKPPPRTPAPQETDDLSRFSGYGAIVMTWTSAEASALAALMRPGYPTSN